MFRGSHSFSKKNIDVSVDTYSSYNILKSTQQQIPLSQDLGMHYPKTYNPLQQIRSQFAVYFYPY